GQLGDRAKRLVGGRREQIVRDRARAIRIRHLAERQVLGKPARRQVVDRAREEREERAAGWMRPARSSVEVRRDAGAPQRVLEKAAVLLRRPNDDGHAVERNASSGLAKDAASNLDRLAARPRRG